MTFNYTVADRLNYMDTYNTNGLTSDDVGFKILVNIGNYFNLSFIQFIGCVFFICLTLVSVTIFKYSKNPGIVITLYAIYPFLYDVVQIRNFISYSLIVFGISFFMDNRKKSQIMFFLIILLSISFHSSSLFFLPLIFVRKITNQKLLLTIVLGIDLFFFIFRDVVLKVVGLFIQIEGTSMNKYFSTSISRLSEIVIFIYILSILALIDYFQKKYLNNFNGIAIESDEQYRYIKMVRQLNIYILLIYPLVLFNFEFIRIFRSILIFDYIVFSNVLYIRKSKMIQDLSLNFMILAYPILSYVVFIQMSFQDTIVIPFFNFNLLF